MNLLNKSNGTQAGTKSFAKGPVQTILKWLTGYWYLFILSIGTCLTLAFLQNRYTEPVFLVKTSLLVKETQSATNNPQKLLYGDDEEAQASKNSLPEEITVLESSKFISRTLDSLHLKVGYWVEGRFRKIELYHDAPFEVRLPDSVAHKKLYGKKFNLVFRNRTHFELSEDGTDNKQNERPVRYKTGGEIKVQDCPLVIEMKPGFPESDINKKFEFQVYDPRTLVWQFRSALNIRQQSPDGSIIQIYMETSVPQKGLDFLNEYTKQYINYKYEEKSRAVSQSLSFINEQLEQIGGSLGHTETSLENFKSANQFSDASKMTDRSLNELSELDRERASLALTDRYYNSVLTKLNENRDLNKLTTPSSVGINDEPTTALMQQLAVLQNEKESYGNTKNPLVNELDQKISTMKNTIKVNVTTLLNNNRALLSQANSKSSQHRGVISSLPRAERRFVDINRANNLNEQMFLFLSQKRLEVGIMKAATTVENKVIEPAILESSVPLRPKKKNNYAIAVLLGLGIPFSLLWVKALFKKTISGKEDYQSMVSVPYIGTIFHNFSPNPLVITASSRTATSESFRILRSYLSSLNSSSEKVILITSMDSGEGKSFTSINIATSLALIKKRTILINLDLRAENDIYKNMEHAVGISFYLDDMASIDEIIRTTDDPCLDFIPAGECPIHSSELFRDDKIAALIKYLKAHYDYVIIDSPPLGKIADPLIIAKYTNLNLVVVRVNYTVKEKLYELDQLYREGKVRNVGVILNDQKMSRKEKNNYYYHKLAPKKKPSFFKVG
jgi:capsular exopolysaccharide synthesis family protein